MAHHSEWMIERQEPGWFGRLVNPGGGSGTAVLVAILGAAAFVGSMAIDWVKVTLPANFGENGGVLQGRTFGQTLVNSATLGQVYALTGIALLAFVGSVVTRADLALRTRLGVTGLGLGMLSVAVAGTISLKERVLEQWGYPAFFGSDTAGVTTALEAGLFCAYAAVVLPVAAVWLAARPAARAARHGQARDAAAGPAAPAAVPQTRAPVPTGPDIIEPVPPASGRAGSTGPITVTASEPLDLSVSPDAWPR